MFEIISVRYTRNLILRAFCIVYLSAFLSLYYQAPGLFGDHGIAPARSVLENSRYKTLSQKIHYQPTLLWLTPYLGLNTSSAVEVLALLGAFLAFTGIVSQKFCIAPVFTALWSLFFSIYQVGQVFVTNSYDELLLEAGFIAILLAPILPGRKKSKTPITELFSIHLARWLLFRFFFNAGIGKLSSSCPKWWNLSAIYYQLQNMPLPNPISWYAYNLPKWVLGYSTVYVNICELLVPFMFVLPIRSTRIAAFYFHLVLQTCIVATGNFGFTNILIVTLLLSLLDDQYFYGKKKPNSKRDIIDLVVGILLILALYLVTMRLYNLDVSKSTPGTIPMPTFAFTKLEFHIFLEKFLPFVGLLAAVTFAVTLCSVIYQLWFNNQFSGNKSGHALLALAYLLISIVLCIGSSVPILSMHPETNRTIPNTARTIYNRCHKAHILNEYNVFLNVGGAVRFEVILEGADNLGGPWKEYNFLYKPGNINHSLSFVAPYSPKLDWHMHLAAQSTYKEQPWLISLAHRLLNGHPEVKNLIDSAHSPFPNRPPTYIRASLYQYVFTTWSARHRPQWFMRERVGEYFPAYAKNDRGLEEFLKARHLWPSAKTSELHSGWKQVLDILRRVTNKFEPTLLFWSVLSAAFAIVFTTSSVS